MLRLSAILACALVPAPTAFARTWTDDTGTYHVDAELAGIENGRALLRRSGGAGEVRIPLGRLSKADRDFLDRTAASGPDALDSPLPSGVDANAIQTAEATVKDSIADDLAAAKTTVRRESLINKLLQMAAGNPTDKASRFVLLRNAAVMAAALGEAQLVTDAMSQLEAMVKDPSPTWNDVFAALDTRHPIQDASLLTDKLNSLFRRAIAKDDYDAAIKYCNHLLAIGKQDKDLGLQGAARTMVSETNLAKEEWKRTAPDREALKQDPSDEKANRAVGRFLVLYKGDFERGLPLLATSGDKALAAAATADLKQKKSSAEMLAVGDSWSNVAKAFSPRTASQERAAYWYRQARSLTDFADRSRIDAKLDPLIQRDWIDLSASVEFPRDQIKEGYWTKEGRALSSGAPAGTWGVMKFPVAPLRNDYELVMQIDYLSDPRYLSIVFPVGGRMCGWVFAGSDGADGLELVDGKYARENATTVKPTLLKKDRRFFLRITVDVQDDRAQIVVYIDRARYTGWQGKLASLDLNKITLIAPGHISIEQADASSIVIRSASLLNK
jgi:hypothetical protein